MFVVAARCELHLPSAGSLKGKRSVLNRLRDKLRHATAAAVAEVEHQDLWQRAALGLAVVSGGVGTTLPVYIDRAHDAVVVDVDGNHFIDLGGGIGVMGAGHTNDAVVAAVQEQVAKVTHTLFTVTPDTMLSDCVVTMAENDIGSLVVMDNGRLAGVLTFREVLGVLAKRQKEHRTGPTPPVAEIVVREVMVPKPVIVNLDTEVNELRRMMLDTHTRYVPVMDGDNIVGIVDESDVLLHVYGDEERFRDPVSTAMVSKLDKLEVTSPIEALLPVFDRGHVAIVVDGDRFVGLITRIDLLNYLRRRVQ